MEQPKPVAQAPKVEKEQVKETTVIVQPPAQQHITVEQVPRYGATDVGRVLSLLDGKGGRLDSKTEGALKLLDIFLKR